jgi:hypothetical protein
VADATRLAPPRLRGDAGGLAGGAPSAALSGVVGRGGLAWRDGPPLRSMRRGRCVAGSRRAARRSGNAVPVGSNPSN